MRWTKVGETDRHGHRPVRPISQPFCTCLWGRSKGEMINTIFFKTCLLIEAMVNWLTKLSINVFNEHLNPWNIMTDFWYNVYKLYSNFFLNSSFAV